MDNEAIKTYLVPTKEDKKFPNIRKKECVVAHRLFPQDVKKRGIDLSKKTFVTLTDKFYSRNFVQIGDFLIFSYNDINNGFPSAKNYIVRVSDKKGGLIYYDKKETEHFTNGVLTANFIDLGAEKPVVFNTEVDSFQPTVVYSTNFSSSGDFLVMYFHKKPFLLYVKENHYDYFSHKNILTLKVLTAKWVENALFLP